MINKKVNVISNAACETIKSEACAVIIFGASGDLAHRKLIPALFNLFITGRISDNFYILGVARTKIDENDFKKSVNDSIVKFNNDLDYKKKFINRCYYISGNYDEINTYRDLKIRIDSLNKKFKTNDNNIYYLALPSTIYPIIIKNLNSINLISKERNKNKFHRIIMEKPFGNDSGSAIELNNELLKYLNDEDIYRIDHYLGKDTVQNILVFRFANSIFEPIWKREYIDNIQITAVETVGVEHRAGYFEQAGLIRDMMQNHMFQLLALVAMEPPLSFDAKSTRDEKGKVLKSIKKINLNELNDCFIRGQYTNGKISNKDVVAYREEKGIKSDSSVETYIAAKLMIDNWRWNGVPFYFRAGKRLNKKETKIVVVFKDIPHCMFYSELFQQLSQNILIFSIQPEQSISLTFQAKHPGAKMCLSTLNMDFNYQEIFGTTLTDDYETLLLDCIKGDQTLFWRKDGIEASWEILTPILNEYSSWDKKKTEKYLYKYPAGSIGPIEAERFIKKDKRKWI